MLIQKKKENIKHQSDYQSSLEDMRHMIPDNNIITISVPVGVHYIFYNIPMLATGTLSTL